MQSTPKTKSSSKPRRPRKNRVRTKTCAKCFTPCTTITRCRIAPATGSVYICDICWPTYCEHNQDYVYEGTWQNGRIVDNKPADPPGGSTRQPEAREPRTEEPAPNPVPDKQSPTTSPRKPAFRKRGRRPLSRLVRREGGGGSARRE